jgi:hypothetical protein
MTWCLLGERWLGVCYASGHLVRGDLCVCQVRGHLVLVTLVVIWCLLGEMLLGVC